MEEKKIFIIGDVHGQLDLLKKLVSKIEKECGSAGYEIVLTGDVMDRGPKSYEAYRYAADHSNISSVLGNHDNFYIGGKIKLMNAFEGGNGGWETFEDMLSYYSDSENIIPDVSSKRDFKLSMEVYFLHFIIKDLFSKNPSLNKRINTECGGKQKTFLRRVLGEMRENLKKQPYLRTFEKNENKFVLTHSGYIPTNKDGKIKTNEELKQIAAKSRSREIRQIEETLWTREEVRSRVNNHIVLHGHNPALSGQKRHGPNYGKESGDLVSVNLDGGTAIMNNKKFSEEVRDSARLLCLELDSGILTGIDRHGSIDSNIKIKGFDQ